LYTPDIYQYHNCNPLKLYYDYVPYHGYRFIILDAYDISSIGSSTEEGKTYSDELLERKNPNLKIPDSNWFTGLSKDDLR